MFSTSVISISSLIDSIALGYWEIGEEPPTIRLSEDQLDKVSIESAVRLNMENGNNRSHLDKRTKGGKLFAQYLKDKSSNYTQVYESDCGFIKLLIGE